MEKELVKEDIYADMDTDTVVIKLDVTMEKGSEDADCDYDVSIDEQTKQIALTPKNDSASFIRVGEKTAEHYVGKDTSSTEDFEIELTANMLSETGNFDYVVDIDAIGQIVITPSREGTEFVSFVIGNDLNVGSSEEDLAYSKDKCIEMICELTDDFKMEDGAFMTFFEEEKDSAIEELEKHYESITTNVLQDGKCWEIIFSGKKALEEDLSQSEISRCEQTLKKLEQLLTESVNLLQDVESQLQKGGIDTKLIHDGMTSYLETFISKNNKNEREITIEKIISMIAPEITPDGEVVEDLNKSTLNENDVEDEGPAWSVKFTTSEGDSRTASVNAFNAEDALKFAEQHQRMMSREDSAWKDAEVTSMEKSAE